MAKSVKNIINQNKKKKKKIAGIEDFQQKHCPQISSGCDTERMEIYW